MDHLIFKIMKRKGCYSRFKKSDIERFENVSRVCYCVSRGHAIDDADSDNDLNVVSDSVPVK